jgi:hypothetical protein
MKTVITRQENILEFSRAAFAALWERQPLEQTRLSRIQVLLKELDDVRTLEEIQALGKKLDAEILVLENPQTNP